MSEHPKYATVAKPRFDGAGSPDIDIAPLRDAFRTWWAQNDRFLADGDTGDVLRRYRRVLVPEINSGQLVRVLRAEYLVDAVGFNRVSGMPLASQEILEAINQILEEKR